MKFLLDHCVPLKIKPLLEKIGHEVITLRELGKSSAPDPEVIKISTSRNSILVTCDSDFFNIIEYPVDSHAGIIFLKFAPPLEDAIQLTFQKAKGNSRACLFNP